MPRLPQSVAAAAEQAEASGGFAPIKPGIYRARFTKVELDVPTKDGNGRKAKFELVVLPDQGVRETKLWYEASHKPEAAGLLKAPFAAAGLTMDSDDSEFLDPDITVRVDVYTDVYQGREKDRIRAFLADDSAEAQTEKKQDKPWS